VLKNSHRKVVRSDAMSRPRYSERLTAPCNCASPPSMVEPVSFGYLNPVRTHGSVRRTGSIRGSEDRMFPRAEESCFVTVVAKLEAGRVAPPTAAKIGLSGPGRFRPTGSHRSDSRRTLCQYLPDCLQMFAGLPGRCSAVADRMALLSIAEYFFGLRSLCCDLA
jgi:hypothetical protein